MGCPGPFKVSPVDSDSFSVSVESDPCQAGLIRYRAKVCHLLCSASSVWVRDPA